MRKIDTKHGLTLVAMLTSLLIVSGCHRVPKSSQDRLESLHHQCEVVLDDFDYSTLDTLSLRYMEGASRFGDKRHLAFAHFYRGATCLYTNRLDTAIAELQFCKDFANQINNDSIIALALNSIGIYEATANNNMYLAQWYFTESLKHAKQSDYTRLECTIYCNLCTLANLQNDTSMMGYARESYAFGRKHDDAHVEFLSALNLSSMFSLKAQYDSALYFANRAIEIGEKNDLNKMPIAYVSSSEILFMQSNFDESEKYAQKAIDLAEDCSDQMVLVNAYNQKALICHQREAYFESNEWLSKALSLSESLDLAKAQIYALMADNHEALGNTEMALTYMKQSKTLAETSNASDRERMKRERDMAFSIIDQERQLEFNRRQLHSRGLIIGGLVALMLLLVYILWMSIRNLRRRNVLYKNIVRQHMESIEREKALGLRVKELESRSIQTETNPPIVTDNNEGGTIDNSPSEKSRRIYDEVCRLMEEERIYTDPQLNRENLAQKVGTNKSYLTNIISECSGGMNLSQFINQYRLQEAVRLLSDKQHIDYPLKQLSADLGFGSISTFYKLFQEKVGMSPSAYRKSFIEVVK